MEPELQLRGSSVPVGAASCMLHVAAGADRASQTMALSRRWQGRGLEFPDHRKTLLRPGSGSVCPGRPWHCA